MDNLYYFVSFTLYYYWFYNQPFFFLLLLFDNLILSFNTFCSIYYPSLTITFYNNSYIDRYIYYFILSIINILLTLLCFRHFPILTYILYLTTIPIIFNFMLTKFNFIIHECKHKVTKLFKFIFYHLTGYIINNFCYLTIQFNPCLNYKDVSVIYHSNYKDNLNLFIKNFILLTVIKSIANTNTYSLTLVKNVYNYNALYPYIDPYPHINDVDKIKKILFKRKWDELFNPYIIELLIKLYEKKGVNKIVPLIEQKISQIEVATAKFFTILTISPLLNFYGSIFLISILLIPYNQLTLQNIIVRSIGTMISYLLNNYTLGIIFCEYIELCNNIISWLTIYTKKWFKENFHILFHFNNYNFILLYHIGFLTFMNTNLLLFIFSILNSRYRLITLWFSFGYFSNYNFFHLLILGLLFYLFTNMYHYKTAPRQKIPLLLLPNYTPKVNKSNDKPSQIYCPVLNCIHNPKYNITPL